MGVQEVGGPGPEALVGQLQRALDLVALGLDADALAAEVHAPAVSAIARGRCIGCSAHARRRRDPAPLVRPPRADARRPGRSTTPTRTSAPTTPTASGRRPQQLLAALDRASGARASCSRCTSRTATAPANDRVLAGRRGIRRAAGRVLPRRPARRRGRRGAPLPRRRRARDQAAPAGGAFTLSEPAVRELVALAHERRVPVLIHAGRGIPALGQRHRRAVAASSRTPG